MREPIEELRKRIDELDGQIVDLINERVNISLQIREEKIRRGLPVRDGMREDEIIRGLQAHSTGPVTASTIESLFRAIAEEVHRLPREGKEKA